MRHLPSREPIPCWDAIRLGESFSDAVGPSDRRRCLSPLAVALRSRAAKRVQEPIPGRRARVVGLAPRAARGSKRCLPALGLSREPLAPTAERIVGILKRTDFEDHCQALTPWLCERPRPEGWARVDEDRGSVEGLGLAEAIEALRDDILKAW